MKTIGVNLKEGQLQASRQGFNVRTWKRDEPASSQRLALNSKWTSNDPYLCSPNPKKYSESVSEKQKSGKVIVGEEMPWSKKFHAVEMFQKDKLLKKGHPENTLGVW